jgi:hypothetical protein
MSNPEESDSEMLDEYDFSEGVRGKYFARYSMRSNIVVVFSANPPSTTTLDLEGELREIEAELRAANLSDAFQFSAHPTITSSGLQRVLLRERPVIVQFSGHGKGGGRTGSRTGPTREVVIEEDPPSASPAGIMIHGHGSHDVNVVSGAALGGLFTAAEQSVHLVFLNACHSAEQATALLQHVDFVVGVDGAILDTAAKVFAVAFYRALAFGRTIQVAFDMAVNALVLHGLQADAKLPVLRVRNGADPKQVAFVAAPKAENDQAWDVYITYADADRDAAHQLAIKLHERHFKVFFDEWTISDGEVTSRRMEEGIRNSLNGIVAVSPDTVMEDWAEEQYSALLNKAVRKKQRLIPVLVGRPGEVDLPPFLATRQKVDLRDPTEATQRRSLDNIAKALRGQPPGPPLRST